MELATFDKQDTNINSNKGEYNFYFIYTFTKMTRQAIDWEKMFLICNSDEEFVSRCLNNLIIIVNLIELGKKFEQALKIKGDKWPIAIHKDAQLL